MLLKNVELEKRKELERVALLEKVVEDFFEYKEMIGKNYDYLNNLSHHVIRNTMMPTPFYSYFNIGKVFQNEKERNNILASHLKEYSKDVIYIEKMRGIIKKYKESQAKLKDSIDDLKHFYKITKYSRSKAKKISYLEKTLETIGDLSPLHEIDKAKRNIEEFEESHSFRFVEQYLDKNNKDEYVLDEQNIYVVNPYYFSDRAIKLKNNIKLCLEGTRKKISKITKNHKNKEQLKRYLQY